MRASEYLALARRSWRVLLVGSLAGLAIAALVTLVQKPSYEASSKALVSTTYADSVTDLSQGAQLAQQIVTSYADVATTTYVLQPVIDRLGLGTSVFDLAKSVTVASPTGTSVIQIGVTSDNPREAASIANAVAGQLEQAVTELSPRSTESAGVRIIQVQQAVPNLKPVSPNIRQNLIAGTALGLIIAVLATLVRTLTDTKVRTKENLEDFASTPFLGSVDWSEELASSGVVISKDSTSRAAEQIRGLRTSLQFLEPDRGARTFLVTSALDGEGKTTAAANLSAALAYAGESTVIVDADLRRPTLASKFGLVSSVGLSDVLIGRAVLGDALQSWGDVSLSVLPSGSIAPNPQELLQSQRMGDILKELSEAFQNVIIDAPPILSVADAAVLGQAASGTILICSTSRVTKRQLVEAVGRLRQVNVKLYGTVATLNKPPKPGHSSYGTY